MIHSDDTKKPPCRKRCTETDDGFVSCNDKHDTENIPSGIPRTLRELHKDYQKSSREIF